MQVQFENALYVVSTPIGHLDDISIRALSVLKGVAAIACEDRRHSRRLLDHHGIRAQLLAYHDHSKQEDGSKILDLLQAGEAVALISDAGTPLLADPGYKLINRVLNAGFEVIPVPGASAALAALSVAGLATDRFAFEGFLPARSEARDKCLQALLEEPRTMLFYESPHRILQSLEAMQRVLGSERQLVVARELTKLFETKLRGTIAEVLERMQNDSDQCRGEFVVVVAGLPEEQGEQGREREAWRVMDILRAELPLKQAAALAAKITGARKNSLYRRALEDDDSAVDTES